MKWIRSALASDAYEDAWVVEGSMRMDGDSYNNDSFGNGIWLRVNKQHFMIVDMNHKLHKILAHGDTRSNRS